MPLKSGIFIVSFMSTDFFIQLLNRLQNDEARKNLAPWASRRVLFDIAGVKLPTMIGAGGEWLIDSSTDSLSNSSTDSSTDSSTHSSTSVPDAKPDLTLQINGADFVWLVQGFDAFSRRAHISGDAGLLEAVGHAFKDIDPQQIWPTNPDSMFPMAQAAMRASFEHSIKMIPQAANQLFAHQLNYWRDERAYLVSKEEMAQRDATLLNLSDAVARLEARLGAHLQTHLNTTLQKHT